MKRSTTGRFIGVRLNKGVLALLSTIALLFFIVAGVEWTVRRSRSDVVQETTKAHCPDRPSPVSDERSWNAELLPQNRAALIAERACPACYLEEVKLERAKLELVNLMKAQLREADLTEVDLTKADLRGAGLGDTILIKAKLVRACMKEARLLGTKLEGAILLEADLTKAEIESVELAGTDLRGSYLNESIFEPRSLPPAAMMVPLFGLTSLRWRTSPHGLTLLRSSFKEAGLRDYERQVTFAIQAGHRKQRQESQGWLTRTEGFLSFLLFELSSDWGMSPSRPVRLLLQLVFVFAVLYSVALAFPTSRTAVWRIWEKDRLTKGRGSNKPESLHVRDFRLPVFAVYFSLVSAFSIGWRELNIGNWIVRVLPGEYTLRGTGWVRVMSGVQSLISVYLLALAVLTYFGRPFE